MLLTPEMCRAARALLRWEVNQLAAASGVAASAIECFEEGSMVEPVSVEVLLEALQNAGLEFIPAGGKSLDGGPGLRTIPMPEPEVIAAEEAAELEEPVLQGPDAI
jgi:transcriptional regulator with XRE-family HTH domain